MPAMRFPSGCCCWRSPCSTGGGPSLGVIAFAVIAAGIFYLIFVTVLGVRMPDGVWPDLIGRL